MIVIIKDIGAILNIFKTRPSISENRAENIVNESAIIAMWPSLVIKVSEIKLYYLEL